MRTTALARLLTVAALSAAPVLVLAAAARADDVPWTDGNANGYLALCDDKGQAVTSGKLTTKPFAALAISSVPAPAGYGVQDQAKGTLYAYQPRPGVDPGDWSGTQLTASSWYSNAQHPMAEGTLLDYSLADFLDIYPTKLDGLVQLRMFLGAPNKAVVTTPYPATTIKVEGDSWHVVQGGSPIGCKVGEATSIEHRNLPASVFASASAAATAAAHASAPASPSGQAGGSSGPGGSSASDPSSTRSASSSSSSSGTDWLWPAIGAIAAATGLALVGLRLRGARTRPAT